MLYATVLRRSRLMAPVLLPRALGRAPAARARHERTRHDRAKRAADGRTPEARRCAQARGHIRAT